MSSQFDALLDFGEQPPPPTSNGSGVHNANGSDDFDPFGPGPQVSGKGGVGDGGGLLLDFSVGADVSGKTENGTGASDPFDTQFTINTSLDTTNSNISSANPFSDMSTTETQPSANPLYDMTDDDLMSGGPQSDYPSSSANPLYDFSTTEEESGQAEYTFETTTTSTTATTEESSANPLYDLMDSDLMNSDLSGQQAQEEPTTTGGGDDDFQSSLPDLGRPFGRKPLSTPSEVDIVVETSDDYTAQSYQLEEEPAAQRFAHLEEEEEEADEREPVLDQIVPDVVPQQETGVPTLLGQEEEEDGEAEQPEQNVELYIREEGEEPQAFVEEEVVSSRHVEEEVEDFTAQQQQYQEEEVEETRDEVQAVLEVQREPEKSRSRSRSPSNHSISSEGEVLNEEEELRQDGRTLYKTKEEKSYNETRHDGKPTEGYGSGDVTDHGHESDLAREHREKEDFHFQEMSSVKNQFERGPQQPQPQPRKQIDIRQEVASVEAGVYESQPQTFQPQYGEDETEEGVYENSPEQRSDVVRESDRNVGAELPSVGTAKNIREKFLSGKVEKAPTMKREMTPPEIVSGGVYESQPKYNPDVVHAGEPVQEEILPEHGMAKNLAAKFKQMEKQGSVPLPSQKREITPDRTTKVEYVSEPRGHVERYEPEIQAGIFESQPATRDDVVKSDQAPEEILPERGAAKNIANKFKQLTSEQSSAASPRSKRELTPDTTGRVEYVSEPTGYVERYEGKAESGVFESQPAEREDVVKSDQLPEEILPERGTARSMAARFKEMEKSTSKSPATPGKYKEFTPPRENGTPTHGVYESTPQVAADVVHSEDSLVDVKPERGTARNIADKFRQLGSSENTPKSPRTKKEFTPPPQTQAEPTVFESEPQKLEGVVSENDTDWNAGLPKADTTKKMLAKFQQIQAQAQADTSSPKPQPQARKEGGLGQSNESSPEKVGRSKSMRVAVQLEKCGACDKTVYAMEKIEIEKHSYHKSCFRCSHCHCVLTPKTFAINQKVMFCTTHYKQLFATKGNYDEGFGHDQHKKRWKSEPNLADDEQQQQHSNHT